MSFMEAAEKAHTEASTKARADAKARSDLQLTHVLNVLWPKAWHDYSKPPKLKEGLDAVPEIDKYQRGKVDVRYGGTIQVAGVIIYSEGQKFIVVTDHGHHRDSTLLIRTCPDCGGEYAESWYGLADLGAKIKANIEGKRPSSTDHTCHQSATERVAGTLRFEADQAKLSASDLARRAVEHLASKGVW